MTKERLFTREEVSQLISTRVNKLNERIKELELELFIMQFEKEMSDIARNERAADETDGYRTTLQRFSRRTKG
ncbi:hypothetical protein ACFFIS_04755 [Virgibacillus soli]|uniref:Uncharacterized protein n=1 Tax=Paracerasibacillus soli TaxID=480284 RepID=A0ABU5CUB6_9BACI|nr:hypothetical protein [Virgibacillus soli]MDY0409965.1 hypothetical protein [Virgibacillus soli]